ncbi:hypothetical protein QBC43DRAFT_231101 [Cladorrhinum sp. PSN259]|nr:hypothetical protein QBC43DRAFT_231101 [Cladorrhinum sp. PSN259]
MPKTVCIVGAGPSGLVAAKSLLHDAPRGTFDVTIFDAQTRIGGLWPSRKDDDDGLIHPLMTANQSRHTVQFSDLAWPEDSPELPRAWQIGQYLDRYFETYCKDAKLQLGKRVERTEALQSGWRVWTQSLDGVAEEHTFDLLLVAAGYFGKPAIPSFLPENPEIPIIHSSRYRHLKGLLGKTNQKGGKILVVGGQMSGVEIAGTVATHLSSAVHSPGTSPIENLENYSIHHLVQQPTWVMPLYLSPKPSLSAPPFLPLDMGSYNLANRLQPLINTQGHISEEAAKRMHSLYQVTLGTDQSNFSQALAITPDDTNSPPYLAVSDTYMDFVRSGLISVSRGKLDSLSGQEATISPSNENISDVAAVILATGFQASSSVSFLPPSAQEAISLASTDLTNTVALGFHGTYHPSINNLGFVGFYRSPYWGVMEMQARFVTEVWAAGGLSSPSLPQTIKEALEKDTSIERTIGLRTDPRASQFPMGDYAWLMQEFGTALGLNRLERGNTLHMDILTPARYPSKSVSKEQQAEITKSLKQTETTAWAGLTAGKFVARAVFRCLLGEWRLERQLISKLPSHPSGHFSGTAKFLLRRGTRDGREAEFDRLGPDGDPGLEYLYVEEGDFKASNGFTFRATRRYIWRYNEAKDKLSVWFAKTDDQKRADYLFHQIDFDVPEYDPSKESSNSTRGWHAKSGHMCIDDYYDVKYEFHFQAVNLKDWRLGYTVKGPQKDYSIDGVYSRA